MTNRTSTLVFDVFACWPPGPPEPVNRHSSSSNGIAQFRVIRSISTAESVDGRLAVSHGWGVDASSVGHKDRGACGSATEQTARGGRCELRRVRLLHG